MPDINTPTDQNNPPPSSGASANQSSISQSEPDVSFPPVIVTTQGEGSNTKGKLAKTIPTILGILLLLVGVVAGILLVRQQQELRRVAEVENVKYACTPTSCSDVGCTNACTASLNGKNIVWTGNDYEVPYGCYAIKHKCINEDRSADGCYCPIENITCSGAGTGDTCEGFDTCDLPNVERYFDRGPTTIGWDQNFCGTQQVDVNCGGQTSYFHTIIDTSPSI